MPNVSDAAIRIAPVTVCTSSRRRNCVGFRTGWRRDSYMWSADLYGHDDVALPFVTEHERVRADDFEPELAVERHRLRIMLPDAEPQAIATGARRGVEGVLHQVAGDAAAVPLGDDVDAVELGGPLRRDARVRVLEPELRVSDHSAVDFRDRRDEFAIPDLPLLDPGAEFLRAMQVHVSRRVVGAEGIAEGALCEHGERWCVGWKRRPQLGQASPGRSLRRRFRNTVISLAACTSPAAFAAAMPRS